MIGIFDRESQHLSSSKICCDNHVTNQQSTALTTATAEVWSQLRMLILTLQHLGTINFIYVVNLSTYSIWNPRNACLSPIFIRKITYHLLGRLDLWTRNRDKDNRLGFAEWFLMVILVPQKWGMSHTSQKNEGNETHFPFLSSFLMHLPKSSNYLTNISHKIL